MRQLEVDKSMKFWKTEKHAFNYARVIKLRTIEYLVMIIKLTPYPIKSSTIYDFDEKIKKCIDLSNSQTSDNIRLEALDNAIKMCNYVLTAQKNNKKTYIHEKALYEILGRKMEIVDIKLRIFPETYHNEKFWINMYNDMEKMKNDHVRMFREQNYSNLFTLWKDSKDKLFKMEEVISEKIKELSQSE